MTNAVMKDRVIALAAVCQCLRQVQQMANNGESQTASLVPCIESLFRFDAETAEAVYGELSALNQGLRALLQQLEGEQRDVALTRMAATILQLERRFNRSRRTIERVSKGLEDIQRQREHYGPTHTVVLNRLGELYSEQISALGSRVLVQGNPVYLAQASVVSEVRATLLAALRAAVLWRQMGGSYWDFLFARKAMTAAVRTLLKA